MYNVSWLALNLIVFG